jgi:multidrug resistance efflux pump
VQKTNKMKTNLKENIRKEEIKLKETIKKEEVKLREEIKKEEKGISWFLKSHTFKIILATLIFAALLLGIYYLASAQGKVPIEKSEINAPVITLSPQISGVLEKIYVKEGDTISADTIVAKVSGVLIKSKIAGLVIYVQNTPGQIVNSQTAVVQMIDTIELRAIGHIAEDKGLKEIREGQKVEFTVDAFGSKKYEGVVESVSSASKLSDIVFSISDKRQEKEFNVKVKFDTNKYPELKQGMSAKMEIYT